ncbi:MAG TPA: cation:proton antiporter, partial [Chitinophagales bacterium]
MHETLPFLLIVVVLIVLIELLAKKIKIAYPILLVLAGLIISTIPEAPKLKINPDWIFFVLLPPLLFEASWSISFKGLLRWWRIISSFSFLVVFFTATSVALFANHFIPGVTLAMGFLLGAIVSPPDAVSAGAIL